MKKLLAVFAVFVSLNLSCEKRMCACFNPPPLTFNLVVKNSVGKDLLNPTTTGAYAKENIKLYLREADGSSTPLAFDINQPIPTGHTKVHYYQLVSPALVSFDRSKPNDGYFEKVAFIQFGDETPSRLFLTYTQQNHRLNLSLDSEEVPKDEKMLPYLNSMFYFTKR